MYIDFFGFTKPPFESIPDPNFFYESPIHREVLSALTYAVDNDKGIIVITGEVGTGKTTVAKFYIKMLPSNVCGIYIDYPFESLYSLMKFIAVMIGVKEGGIPNTVIELSLLLKKKLIELYNSGKKLALIIDESQHLSVECLEYIRLLSNFTYGNRRLVNIVLVGQNELLTKLRLKELRQLRQRISAWVEISPFNMEQTSNYIKHRLLLAGSYDNPFTSRAIKLIYKKSKGIPRLINIICDNALLAGYAENKKKISRGIVKKAIKESSLLDVREIARKSRLLYASSSLLALLVISFVWLKLQKSSNNTSTMKTVEATTLSSSSSYIAPAENFFNEVNIEDFNLKDDLGNLKLAGLESSDEKANGQYRKDEEQMSNNSERVVSFPEHDRSRLLSSSASSLKVTPKDYLLKIIKKAYGKSNDTLLDLVQTANPEIEDINLIVIGQKIFLPKISMDMLILKDAKGRYFLHYCSFYSKSKAYKKLLDLSSLKYPVSLNAVKMGKSEIYRIYVGPFLSRAEAIQAFESLPRKHLPF